MCFIGITHVKDRKATFCFGEASWAGGYSAVMETPVKIIIPDESGSLIACDCRPWYFDDETEGFDRGYHFVPSNLSPVDESQLSKVDEIIWESNQYAPDMTAVHFMLDKTGRFQAIRFAGTEEQILPPEYWNFILFTIPKESKRRYKHKFIFYKFK